MLFFFSVKGFTSSCGTLTATSDWSYLSSGNYPSNYDDFTDWCAWDIHSTNNRPIELHFMDFSLYNSGNNCEYDGVSLYDGMQLTNYNL